MVVLRKLLRGCVPAVCALGVWQSAWAGEQSTLVRTYTSPDGLGYGSISLRAAELGVVDSSLDLVVLIDTSASQVGEHRQLGLDVLQSLLRALPAHDRVAVLAMDVRTADLSGGLQSPELALKASLERLEDRVPAGATDLLQGLQAARQLLSSSSAAGIVVIGDGMSAAHLIQADELREFTAALRSSRVPVHSFAVGSQLDLQLLGTLAQETGGVLLRDERGQTADRAGQRGQELAAGIHRVVMYPDSISFSELDLLPARALPVRSDRDTVHLFSGTFTPELQLTLTERDVIRRYSVTEPVRDRGNAFLRALYQMHQAQDGLGLGLGADWVLGELQQSFEDHVARIEAEGYQALVTGNFNQAEKLGFELQSLDPANARARSLINAAGAGELRLVAQVEGESEAGIPAPAAEPAANPALQDRLNPRPAAPIDQYLEDRSVKGARLSQQVEKDLERARQQFRASPDAGISTLEKTRANVKSATDVDPELLENLLRRVNGELLQLQSNRRAQDAANAQRLVRRAEVEAQRSLIDYQTDRENQLEQMVNRIRALLDDGFHGNPEAFEQAEAQARQVISAYPLTAIGTAEVLITEAAGQLDKADRLRQLRADRFLETLYLVEKSHIPFPDEPPILYPPAEVWQALTEMREKWKSVDLHQSNENERRIYEALKDTTSLEFPGNPLSDVIQFISLQHEIPIRLDEPALSAEGIGPDQEVKMLISGITLRSALKLLLEDVGGVALTYVIEDEVMKITTQTKADEVLQTRVYPVADLVIPIFPLGGGFGGGGGGGFGGGGGGFGGGQGGFGGGQGGFGGGQGGFGGGGQGGFGGGGGGFFSVPAEKPAAGQGSVFDAQSIQRSKKKLN